LRDRQALGCQRHLLGPPPEATRKPLEAILAPLETNTRAGYGAHKPSPYMAVVKVMSPPRAGRSATLAVRGRRVCTPSGPFSQASIGTSSPAASVEGARWATPDSLQSESSPMRPPGSPCGASSAVKLVTSWPCMRVFPKDRVLATSVCPKYPKISVPLRGGCFRKRGVGECWSAAYPERSGSGSPSSRPATRDRGTSSPRSKRASTS
jgi:hypothetical protein